MVHIFSPRVLVEAWYDYWLIACFRSFCYLSRNAKLISKFLDDASKRQSNFISVYKSLFFASIWTVNFPCGSWSCKLYISSMRVSNTGSVYGYKKWRVDIKDTIRHEVKMLVLVLSMCYTKVSHIIWLSKYYIQYLYLRVSNIPIHMVRVCFG